MSKELIRTMVQIRIIIAGSRHYENYEEAERFIDECISVYKGAEFIFLSGGCRGADMIGERYAEKHGYTIELHRAQWNKYGKKAGPVRNMEMAGLCDTVICFWDGKSKGTGSLIKYSEKLRKKIFIKYI